MVIVHLTASRFFGGPERQMLELAKSLQDGYESVFVSFREAGLCEAFLEEVRRVGFEGIALKHDTPRLFAAGRELVQLLRRQNAAILCCHGYKADLLGLIAARCVRIPVVAVSRGWTGESTRVRLYERVDRFVLRWMDRAICVSEGQARKVRQSGVTSRRAIVIRNAVRTERFAEPREEYRRHLRELFRRQPDLIVGAAGRLSPEKGFDVLVDAAVEVVRAEKSVGFVLFGDGGMRRALASQVEAQGLGGRFVFAGFRRDFDHYLPHLDLLVLPSFTEGLPNVVLEAFAAGVPMVATAVGGTPEIIQDAENGYLVPPGNARPLAARILDLLSDDAARRAMGASGRERVRHHFSFSAQARSYELLFDSLAASRAGQFAPRTRETPHRRCLTP